MDARLRMLMNAQSNDGSPGGGAAAGQGAATTAAAQAQGQAGGVTLDQVKELFADFKNSVNADTRRMVEGMVGKRKGGQQATADAGTTTTSTATSAEDPQRIIEQARAFDRATRRLDISDAALDRMERAFRAESPDNPAEWVKQYLADFGLDKQQQTAATSATTTTAAWAAAAGAAASGTGAPTKSDRGGQAGTVLTDDTPVIDMSDADREAWIKKNGVAAYYRRAQQELKGRKLRIEARK